MPIYFTDRVRTLDEINYEISNLGLNINIKLENPRVANSAVSCIVENYKPNIEKGLIQIISESYKNIFKFILSDSLELNNSEDEGNRSVEIAKNIRAEKINDVEFLTGFFESSVSTKEYKFKVKKVNL